MRIAVLGDGAMGSLFGGYLSTKHDVTIVGVVPQRIAMMQHGVTIIEKNGEVYAHPRCVTDTAGMEPVDLLLLFVKSIYNKDALTTNRHLIGPETYILSFQNGAGHETVIQEFTDNEHIIIGTTQHNASSPDAGKVIHGGWGTCTIGLVSRQSEKIVHIAQILTESGFKTAVSDNVKHDIWAKVCNNSSVSASTAVLQCSMEYLAHNKEAWAMVDSLCRETVAVAIADGYEFDPDQEVKKLYALCFAAHNGYTSIYTDVQQGRKTEVDRISGYVVEMAHRYGVPAPKQELIVQAIHALEAKSHEM